MTRHDPNAFEREQALFILAAAKPVADRAAFLDRECGGDTALRARLEALLAAHEEPEPIMDTLATQAKATMKVAFADPPDEAVGQKIGRYKILEKVGEGGCGVVYVAEQTEPVRRRVALKVIKLGMDTKQVVARFEAERQALAMMDHPNIAKVLDAGTTDTGRPYFVMELVRGIRITDYCDQNNLPTKERLDLFILVCRAIQHAHQKGIIHRDIKPSNILVTLHDGVPVPKVIDFGIAKATEGRLSDATVYTQLHQFIGTPAYMSPEQAEMSGLDIDTRSDIYSLGVLLYELLVGQTPFDAQELASQGIEAMRRTIREKEPVRPSTRFATLKGEELTTTVKRRSTDTSKLLHQLKGDLDWIVMKCLEKDRTRRYETANGVAADLKRHLENEPVVARPPSAAYRFQKAFRRNKLVFTAGGAIAAALVLGIAASGWQAVRAQHESARAKSAEQRAVAALDELRATAPAFVEQARSLAAMERFDDAIEKLNYAVKLRPDVADYLVAKGDLLQCQFKFAEAAASYRAALRVQPGLARAEASAKLCDELLAAKPNEQGKLTRESLAKLSLAMQQQQRPAAELMPVARLLGEEKKLLLEYWLARLQDLPISPEKPLKDRLTVRDDGRLALDLSDTKVTDLSPLAGAPLAALNVSSSKEQSDLTDLSPLRGLDLVELNLSGTSVADLTPLREMHTLEKLNVSGSKVTDIAALRALQLDDFSLTGTRTFDISALRGMKLKKLSLRDTRVADLSPLAGMPLTFFDATDIPATDYSPLAGAPLEKCIIQSSPIRDLTFLQNSPVKELTLFDDNEARGFAVLAGLNSLDLLILPQSFRSLPDEELAAIGALRAHPTLKNIQTELRTGSYRINTAQAKNDFWKDWDREQSFVGPLRKSGIKFALQKLPTGLYSLTIQNQPLRDLSLLRDFPLDALDINGNPVTDLSPLRGKQIKQLTLDNTKVSDLGPLQGMRIENLSLANTWIADLSVLRGMPLKSLQIGGTAVTNLEPLRGMPLENFLMYDTKVTDLSPLAGMPLYRLHVGGSKVKDLSVVRSMPLTYLRLHSCSELTDLSPVADCKSLQSLTLPPNATNIECLRALPKLQRISFVEDQKSYQPDKTPAEFWKDYEGEAWVRGLRESGFAIKGLERLSVGTWKVDLSDTKINDLALLKGALISSLTLNNTAVSDLSPLRGMPLKSLYLDKTRVSDLGPLQGMRIEYLSLADTSVADLSGLRGMPLKALQIGDTAVTNLEPLRGMPLESFLMYDTKVTDLSPLAGMPLNLLHLGGSKVKDLSVVRGMPLTYLRLHSCSELTDISPLADCKALQSLTLPPNATNIECLRALPKLERIGFVEDQTSYQPDKTTAEFWRDYDTKKKAVNHQP